MFDRELKISHIVLIFYTFYKFKSLISERKQSSGISVFQNSTCIVHLYQTTCYDFVRCTTMCDIFLCVVQV